MGSIRFGSVSIRLVDNRAVTQGKGRNTNPLFAERHAANHAQSLCTVSEQQLETRKIFGVSLREHLRVAEACHQMVVDQSHPRWYGA